MAEYSLLFILGACIGSFLNVLIYRLPKKQDFVKKSSFCTSCNTPIKWYNNIPILSFLILRGRCATCKKPYSITYFFVEIISALLTMTLISQMGISYESISFLVMTYFLIVLSFIDFKYKAVPDYLLLIVFILSFFASSYPLVESFKNAFIFAGAFVLLDFVITFYIQNIKSKITKDESLKEQKALGEGDIPIIAMIGAVLGLKAGLSAIFLASIFAIIPAIYNQIFKKDIETAFIPFLSLGFLVEFIFNISKGF